MKLGTNDHRKRFCRTFLDSHHTWDTEQFSWPFLDSESRDRLQSIPGWSKLLQKKQQLSRVASAYEPMVKNPLIREAIALLGQEHQRQATVLKKLISTYDIPRSGDPISVVGTKLEANFVQAQKEACLDTVWRFGWFGLAQHHHFLPTELLDFGDRLLQEESRQIIFFLDWLSYRKARQRKWSLDWGSLPALWRDRNTILQFVSAFGVKEDAVPTPLSPLLEITTAEEFLEMCLQESQRRFAAVDSDISRPQLGVATAKVLREVVRLWPQRKDVPTIYNLDPD